MASEQPAGMVAVCSRWHHTMASTTWQVYPR